jgi:Baseplate J-like protein
MYLAAVKTYTEVIWYADNPTEPTVASSPTTGIPVLHSEITFTPSVSAPAADTLMIRYGWQDVGVLISPPATSFDGTANLIAVNPPEFPTGEVAALLQDQNGNGDYVSGTVNPATPSELQLSENLPLTVELPLDPTLDPPINALTNLVPFTRGKTVTNEVLGSGDATQTGQVFTLAKSPLTYLLSAVSTSGNNYTSTLQLWVNGVLWQEQPSFYGQAANATIFVTREDDNAVTYVQFGDGVNGARLPSGANNVTANYRYGSGANTPAAGTLTVINTPQPGFASIQNPVAPGGGADPEPSSQMRQYAPLSVLTFGRAISGDDYEAIAAATPGVTRASAVWSFDADEERTVVTVYVGDDQSAQNAAQLALSGDADPNRPLNVVLATPIPLTITLTLAVNPNYGLNAVAALAVTALTDPNEGLFGTSNIGIGQAVYRSQIYAACLSVPGAVAVHNLSVEGTTPGGPNYCFDPGLGGFFTLSPVYTGVPPTGLQITPEVAND